MSNQTGTGAAEITTSGPMISTFQVLTALRKQYPSYYRIAKEMQVKMQTVSNWKNGKAKMGTLSRIRAAKLLGEPVEEQVLLGSFETDIVAGEPNHAQWALRQFSSAKLRKMLEQIMPPLMVLLLPLAGALHRVCILCQIARTWRPAQDNC